jgi:HPt (histidine-containing phosphotransfer) domain-containing protein
LVAADMAERALVDISIFDGLPAESVTRLASIFYVGKYSAAAKQINAIARNIEEGGDSSSSQVDYRLHQLAASAQQAGAALFSRTCKELREDPDKHVTLDNLETLRCLLERTADELRSMGILPPVQAPAQPEPGESSCAAARAPPVASSTIVPPPMRAGSGSSSDANDQLTAFGASAGGHAARLPGVTMPNAHGAPLATPSTDIPLALEPLSDLRLYEGMPRHRLTELITSFYCSRHRGSANVQLDELDAALRSGASPASEDVMYRLHQLAGSALQAGAVRLGKTSRSFREEPSVNPISMEGLDHLRDLLEDTADELRATGVLAA